MMGEIDLFLNWLNFNQNASLNNPFICMFQSIQGFSNVWFELNKNLNNKKRLNATCGP